LRSAPAAVSDLKRLLSAVYEGSAEAGADERRTFAERAQHPDHAEALLAVFEGRPPRFAPRSR
jgi:hypothetical protein